MKKKINKKTTQVKSFILRHHANPQKLDSLFDFYQVYKSEYQHHVLRYWKLFINNQINNNKFSHLGSTKIIGTALNSAYLQICLNQSCSLLNNYLSNLKEKFTSIIYKSSLKDKDQLHQLHAINLQHAWLNKKVIYKPEFTRQIMDDFGDLINVKYHELRLVSEDNLKLARKIFKQMIDKKVRFPNLNKPRLLLDSRVYSLEKSKSKSFDYWLHIATLLKGKRISIPIKNHDYFNLTQGELGKTIELDFRTYDYQLRKPKHNSLIKPVKQKQKKGHKYKGYVNINKEIKFIFNKQIPIQETARQLGQNIAKKYQLNNKQQFNLRNNNHSINNKPKKVGIDLGLSTLMATSDGKLLGNNWLDKLKAYDHKIQTLASTRQSLGLKTRSRHYDKLIQQVRGFIKTETNRILNNYIENNSQLETITVEKLRFSSPELSKRLNRILQNFGLKIFKDKLNSLSLIYGFKVEEINPAYSSQECFNCGYVDKNNRKTQSIFKCLCCKLENNADIQASRVIEGRSLSETLRKQSLNKSQVLSYLIKDFHKNSDRLIAQGIVGRRQLNKLLNSNPYFKVTRTTKVPRVEPMTDPRLNL